MLRKALLLAAATVPLALGLGCGLPGFQLLEESPNTAMAGVAARLGVEAADNAVVFNAAQPLDATMTAADGVFHLSTDQTGLVEIVAVDLFGYATSLTLDLPEQGGALIDLGIVPLDVCLTGTSGGGQPPPPDGNVGSCPDQPLGLVPPTSSVVVFSPDTTDVALSGALGQAVTVHAKSVGQNLALGLVIPENSTAYGSSKTTLDDSGVDSASLLLFSVPDPTTKELYVYQTLQATLEFHEFNPSPGGRVAMSVRDALFAWFDPGTGAIDPSHTITITSTGTTMVGRVSAPPITPSADVATNSDPFTPSVPSIALGTFQPEFTIAYTDGAGGTYVHGYAAVNALEDAEIYVHVTSQEAGLSSLPVSNNLSGDSSTWSIQVAGGVFYYASDGYVYDYILETGTVSASNTTSIGEFITASLSQAHFLFTPDYVTTNPAFTVDLDQASMGAIIEDPYGPPNGTVATNTPPQ